MGYEYSALAVSNLPMQKNIYQHTSKLTFKRVATLSVSFLAKVWFQDSSRLPREAIGVDDIQSHRGGQYFRFNISLVRLACSSRLHKTAHAGRWIVGTKSMTDFLEKKGLSAVLRMRWSSWDAVPSNYIVESVSRGWNIGNSKHAPQDKGQTSPQYEVVSPVCHFSGCGPPQSSLGHWCGQCLGRFWWLGLGQELANVAWNFYQVNYTINLVKLFDFESILAVKIQIIVPSIQKCQLCEKRAWMWAAWWNLRR